MAKTNESNVWDQDPPSGGRLGSTCVKWTPSLKQGAKAKVVRDDWYDDDEEEEEEQGGDADEEKERRGDGNAKTNGAPSERWERETEEVGSTIWEEANKRTPMPELIVASASTSQSLPPPPPAALQPALRILKRPSTNASANSARVVSSAPLSSSSPGPISGSGSGSGGTTLAPRGTLAEREAQYQEARSRIFGEESRRVNSGGVVVVRDPLGPTSEPELEPRSKAQGAGRPAKGFGERRKGKKQ